MAMLTPAELAALLGPLEAQSLVKPLAMQPVADEDRTRWQQFAETFSRTLTARLRPLVRSAARVTLQDCHTLTAADATRKYDGRSVVGWWQSSGSLEPLALLLAPQLTATFVDRLLGGRITPENSDTHDQRLLTEVDQRLATRLLDAARLSLVESMESAASEQGSGQTELAQIHTSFVEAWLPDDELRRFSFDLRFVQGGGTLDLLLPLDIASPLATTAEEWTSHEPPPILPVASTRSSIVVARLAQTPVASSDLQTLAVGDVLLTDVSADQPLEVLVDGRPRFHGQPGTWDAHKAVRLRKPLTDA